MSFETITTEVTDGILTLTLNRPEMLNAFNQIMLSEMIAAFDEADADDNVRAIIVTGAGTPSMRMPATTGPAACSPTAAAS